MKKFIIALFIVFIMPVTSIARDYIVDFISENYKEETEDFKHHLQVYHTIQITCAAGSKVLIIEGSNYKYRTWLREYLSNSKKMIIKIPDKDNNNFISSLAYAIDVTSIYPLDMKTWGDKNASAGLKVIQGEKHILIVDSNIKRKKLFNQIIQDLGYPVTFLSDSNEALKMFMIQPGNFHMVIANYDIKNFKKAKLIEKLSDISPHTPIIVGGAYNNKKVNDQLYNDFSKMKNVTIRPVILKNLSKLIITLLKNNV